MKFCPTISRLQVCVNRLWCHCAVRLPFWNCTECWCQLKCSDWDTGRILNKQTRAQLHEPKPLLFQHVTECSIFSTVQKFWRYYGLYIVVTRFSSGHPFLCTVGISYSYSTYVHISSSPISLLVICICSVGLSTSDCCSKWPHQVCHPSTAERSQCAPERFRGQKLSHYRHSKSPQVWKLLHAWLLTITLFIARDMLEWCL